MIFFLGTHTHFTVSINICSYQLACPFHPQWSWWQCGILPPRPKEETSCRHHTESPVIRQLKNNGRDNQSHIWQAESPRPSRLCKKSVTFFSTQLCAIRQEREEHGVRLHRNALLRYHQDLYNCKQWALFDDVLRLPCPHYHINISFFIETFHDKIVQCDLALMKCVSNAGHYPTPSFSVHLHTYTYYCLSLFVYCSLLIVELWFLNGIRVQGILIDLSTLCRVRYV